MSGNQSLMLLPEQYKKEGFVRFIKGCVALLSFLLFHSLSWSATLCNGKAVLGSIEKVILQDQKVELDAKLDTGAEMSSLSAKNIEIVKQGQQTVVRFILEGPKLSKVSVTAPFVRMTHIVKRKDESQEGGYSNRPVVRLPICLGGVCKTILVNLIDRSHFHYSMLLGVEALKKFNGIVDVSERYLVGKGLASAV